MSCLFPPCHCLPRMQSPKCCELVSVTNQSKTLCSEVCIQVEPPFPWSTSHKDSFCKTQVNIHLTKLKWEEASEEINAFPWSFDQKSMNYKQGTKGKWKDHSLGRTNYQNNTGSHSLSSGYDAPYPGPPTWDG